MYLSIYANEGGGLGIMVPVWMVWLASTGPPSRCTCAACSCMIWSGCAMPRLDQVLEMSWITQHVSDGRRGTARGLGMTKGYCESTCDQTGQNGMHGLWIW